MKKLFILFYCLILVSIFSQCANYALNIATIPPEKVEIYINDQYKATTDANGTASIRINNVSFEQVQFIETKAKNYYGFVSLSYGKGISPDMKNVQMIVNRFEDKGKKNAKQRYDILFIIPETSDSKFNPAQLAELNAMPESDIMDEDELNKMFEKCKYISNKRERENFADLGFEEKKLFWKNFWDKRDLDKTTTQNEFKDQYFKRIKEADKKFSHQSKDGWETDRGRVLIIYGEPDEVEIFPQMQDTKAYEIWNYFGLQGGIQFIFVSLRGGRDMRLVHSTARDELFDPNWERWLK